MSIRRNSNNQNVKLLKAKHHIFRALALSATAGLTACSFGLTNNPNERLQSGSNAADLDSSVVAGRLESRPWASASNRINPWIQSGSIMLSRPLPSVSLSPFPTALGFLPQEEQHPAGHWISIDKSQGTISLMKGGDSLHAMKADGINSLTPGTYKILHKQRNPLWHAPDEYFTKRHLPVPPIGDKLRFRKGALGDFVMFLDKNTPIHSGLIWTDEIGGLRMSENDLARLYYQLEVGSTVQIG